MYYNNKLHVIFVSELRILITAWSTCDKMCASDKLIHYSQLICRTERIGVTTPVVPDIHK